MTLRRDHDFYERIDLCFEPIPVLISSKIKRNTY